MSHIAVVPPQGRSLASGESELGKRAPWTDFFGLPPGGELALKQQIDPYQRYPRETLHLPEVYRGHNPYLTQIMIDFISEEDLTPIRVILPLRETVNESSIVWDEYHFNNALLGPVPEEGVSRLVTQQISERQDHYVRGGLAFMIEHGFWQSEKGRQNYALQLTQIKNATLDGLYVGVLEALLMCKSVTNYYIQTLQHSITRNRLERSLKLEVESWAEVQKTPNGWDMLNSRAHKALKINGFVPDCWVVDEGTKRYVATVRPENSQYLLGGPEGKALYNSALPASSNPKLLDLRTGCMIFETKSFESPDSREPVNPLSRPRSIGEYNYSGPFQPVTRHSPYYSASRTIVVYDESRDGWAHIDLMMGLDHCNRFSPQNPDGDEFHTSGNSPHFYDDYPHFPSDGVNSSEDDMFMCGTGDDCKPAQYIGDISKCIKCNGENNVEVNGLPDDAISDWANSVIWGLDEETEQGLRDLKHLMYKIENEYNDTKSPEYLKALVAAVQEKGLNDDGTISFDYIKEKLNEDIMCWPHGFSSCVGLDYLAQEGHASSDSPYIKEAHKLAAKGMKAFDRLYSKLESACYDNVFFNAAAVPDYYKRKESRYAFFANLFHAPLPAMAISGAKEGSYVEYDRDPTSYNSESFFKLGETHAAKFFSKDLTFDTSNGDLTKSLNEEEAIKRLFAKVITTADGNVETVSETTDFKNAKFKDPEPEHKSIYDNLKKKMYDAANIAELDDVNRNNLLARMIQSLLGLRFAEHIKYDVEKKPDGNKKMEFEIFLLFVDYVTSVESFDDFANMYETLVKGKVDNINPYEDWTSKGVFKTKMAATILKKEPINGAADKIAITSMTASTAVMEKIGNNDDLKNNLKFTKDFTDGSPSTRRYGFGGTMDGSVAKTARGALGLVAQFDSLPVVIGSAAFADVGAMAGDGGGQSTASRFNFAQPADQQRAMDSDDAFPRSGIMKAPSKAFRERFDEINREPELLTRVVKQALLGVPLTKRALAHFIKRDVVFPFNMLYFRPYMTYNMSTGVCLKAGASTGETLVGQSDFQMGDDVQRKVHFGHYTIKYKSIVYNERAVYHAHDYMCTGYLGGNDTRFVTRKSQTDFAQSQGDNEHFHSMFACLVPYQRTAYPNPMDITGSFYDRVRGEKTSKILHYPSAKFYSKYWGWSNEQQESPNEAKYTSERGTMNTVCFQGHQAMFSPNTGSYTQVIENTGHWGRNVYPGVGKVRAGLASAIQQVSYSEAYGGAAQQSHVTL